MKEIKDIKELNELKVLKEDFINFMRSYGVVGVAIGIVMGQAAAKVINVIVENLVMPILEVMLSGSKWQEATIHLGKVSIKVGLIIAALIDFFVVALVVYFFFRHILKIKHKQEEEKTEEKLN